MNLSDTSIRKAKPRSVPYKMSDGNGLALLVTTAGSRLWQVRYRFHGKENVIALGAYPDVSLKEARERRDAARKKLAAGVDPNADKKKQALVAQLAAASTFNAVALEFIDKKTKDGLAEATLKKARWFTSLLQKGIGDRPIGEIEPLEVLALLKKIEKQGNHETAKRTRAFAARVFRYAVITGRAKFNPAADLGEALVVPKVKHHAALIDPKAVGGLLRAIDSFEGHTSTLLALKLAPHVFVRPGELRHAEWSEFDLEAAVWRIPGAKMKMRNEHAVPLSRQSLSIIEEARKFRGKSRYVFPALQTWLRPMSENTLNAALRRLGYSNEEMTSHGFRSTASTLLNESGKWTSDAIERALAHKDSNAVRGIYHRGTHWEERVEMAQWWSDYLYHLRAGGTLTPKKFEPSVLVQMPIKKL
jgi:integrase